MQNLTSYLNTNAHYFDSFPISKKMSGKLKKYNQDIITCFINSIYWSFHKFMIIYNFTNNIKKPNVFIRSQCLHSIRETIVFFFWVSL